MTDSPIIIGSSPSAGSTMLRVVLGRDLAICSGGELAVMDRPSLFDVDRRSLHEGIESWLEDFPRQFVTGHHGIFARLEDWGWQKAELIALAQESDSWGHLLANFFSESVRRRGARRWLEKTPGNVYGFVRAHEVFPEAFFVHVIRDGRDAIASLMRRKESAFLATSRWMCAVLAGLRLRRFARYFELHYEALVTAPEASLRALCAFVGQAYLPDLHEAADRAARPAAETWHAAEAGPISRTPIGGHRSADSEMILAHMAAVRLSDFGRSLLPRPSGYEDLGDLSALELQRWLGYDHGEKPIRALAPYEIASIEQEIAHYHTDQRERHGASDYPCPTRIERAR